MRTAVVFKWTRNPQDAIVRSDGTLKWDGVKMSATDDDPAAMDIAKMISEPEEIVGVTVGDGKPEWAAARGAESTVIVEGIQDLPSGASAAQAIAKAVEALGDVDVVIIGDSDWNRSVPCALVGKLGWSAYANVVQASRSGDGLALTVKTSDGLTTIQAHTPVLIEALALHSEQDKPGMKQTLAARKKPVQTTPAEDYGITGDESTQVIEIRKPEMGEAVIFDGSDPAEAAKQLVKSLVADGVL